MSCYILILLVLHLELKKLISAQFINSDRINIFSYRFAGFKLEPILTVSLFVIVYRHHRKPIPASFHS